MSSAKQERISSMSSTGSSAIGEERLKNAFNDSTLLFVRYQSLLRSTLFATATLAKHNSGEMQRGLALINASTRVFVMMVLPY